MRFRFLITVFLSTTALTAQAQDHVFSAKEMGLPGSSYVVSETDRTPATVSVSIPDFEKRSAPESRWMMCVYTNLAMIYHHPYWAVVYPEIGSDTVLVGFPAAADPDSLQALGPAFLGPKALKNIIPVDKMKPFCERLGYPFKYLTGM